MRALEDSPLLLDLAHLNDAGFYEALELYAPPVLVTHTFCRAIADHPRGLADEQLRAIGEHGGLVGLAFVPDFLGQRVRRRGAAAHRPDRLAGWRGCRLHRQRLGCGRDGRAGRPAALVGLVNAVDSAYGSGLAEKFAFANAYDFLCAQLPLAE